MKLLLDTCTFLWITIDSPELSGDARRLFVDPANSVLLSAVSAWEICVKHGLGKLPLPQPAPEFIYQMRVAHGILSLPLNESAAVANPWKSGGIASRSPCCRPLAARAEYTG